MRTRDVVRTWRSLVVVSVVGVLLGLAVGFVATVLDLDDDPAPGADVAGSGFVFIVAVAAVGLISLAAAVRSGRSRRAQQDRLNAPPTDSDETDDER